jgi:hypothetical protein
MAGCYLDDELERIRKEAMAAYSKYCLMFGWWN